MFYEEIDSFMTSVETGVKTRANIDNVIITQRVLNGIYDSSNANKEIQF
jgi:hypothetical protein